VHRADERPLLTPWTDGSPEDRARIVLKEHWGQFGSWSVAAWRRGGSGWGSSSTGTRSTWSRFEHATSSLSGRSQRPRGWESNTSARATGPSTDRSAHTSVRPPRRHCRAHRGVPGQPLLSGRVPYTVAPFDEQTLYEFILMSPSSWSGSCSARWKEETYGVRQSGVTASGLPSGWEVAS
jgi:hypothetical protein